MLKTVKVPFFILNEELPSLAYKNINILLAITNFVQQNGYLINNNTALNLKQLNFQKNDRNKNFPRNNF